MTTTTAAGEDRVRLVVEFEHRLSGAARRESSDGGRALSAHLAARRGRTTDLYCPACDVTWACRVVRSMARDLLGIGDIDRHLAGHDETAPLTP